MAEAIVVGPKMNAKLSDGLNEYNQAMNCLTWAPQRDADGYPTFDPDGFPLKTLEKNPGTVTCAWKVRVVYKMLKKAWNGKPHNIKNNREVV